MATIPRHFTSPIPMGRPSQNLGHIGNSMLNGGHNLPVNIFPSNPLTLSPLNAIANAVNKTAQITPITPFFSGPVNKFRRRRFFSEIGSAVSVGPSSPRFTLPSRKNGQVPL